MQGLIASYRLASFGRLQWLLIGSTLCLAVLAVALGAFACLLQLALLALSYLAVTFLCYHPEAQHLRDRVDQFYASLFHYLFRTGHAPRGCPQRDSPPLISQVASQVDRGWGQSCETVPQRGSEDYPASDEGFRRLVVF